MQHTNGSQATTAAPLRVTTWDLMRRKPAKSFKGLNLTLSWSVDLAPRYVSQRVNPEAQLRNYVTDTVPRLAEKYGLDDGCVPLLWFVCGRPLGTRARLLFEAAAPFQPHRGDGPRPVDFLQEYTPPRNSNTGREANWNKDIPVEPNAFIGDLLGYRPAPLTPTVNLRLLAAAAGVILPEKRRLKTRTTIAA